MRALLLLVMGKAMLEIYFLINQNPMFPPVAVTMPDWVSFWPLLTAPYLAMLVVPWFVPLLIQDRNRFVSCLRAYCWGFLLIVPLWIFYPTEMLRPEAPSEWWHLPYRRLVEVDAPTNILPCGHVLAPVIAMCFVARERTRWLWTMLPLLAAGMVSIVTTWQHRPVDVALGSLLALLAVRLGSFRHGGLPTGEPHSVWKR